MQTQSQVCWTTCAGKSAEATYLIYLFNQSFMMANEQRGKASKKAGSAYNHLKLLIQNSPACHLRLLIKDAKQQANTPKEKPCKTKQPKGTPTAKSKAKKDKKDKKEKAKGKKPKATGKAPAADDQTEEPVDPKPKRRRAKAA